MTKKLDPEIKLVRSLVRLTKDADPDMLHRVLVWLVSYHADEAWVELPKFTDRRPPA